MFSGLDHEAVVEGPKISPGADVTFWSKETSRHSARSWVRRVARGKGCLVVDVKRLDALALHLAQVARFATKL